MKKIAIVVATALVLSLSALAYAQTGGNTYEVTGSTSPTKSGTKSKPRAVSIKFGFDVTGANGQRPAVVNSYAITFEGLRTNHSRFPTCSISKMEQEQSVDDCPRNSVIGTGYITNATGQTADPNDRSIPCNAQLWVVNSGGGKGAIFVKGTPTSSDPRTRCAIELAAPIPTTFKNSSKGATLTFTVPQTLKHPLPTLDNAVLSTTATIKNVKVKGRGFYESVGGCKNRKRQISVKFTPESGAAVTETTTARCS